MSRSQRTLLSSTLISETQLVTSRWSETLKQRLLGHPLTQSLAKAVQESIYTTTMTGMLQDYLGSMPTGSKLRYTLEIRLCADGSPRATLSQLPDSTGDSP